jgi:hypothetical protein
MKGAVRLTWCVLITAMLVFGIVLVAPAQDDSKPWSSTSNQSSPVGLGNPTRSSVTHTEVDGRSVDKTTLETLGPDGRYVPYQEIETESVHDGSTVRKTERTYGRDGDGRRTLVQEQQEESRSLSGGEQKLTRTTLSPDANGSLQIVKQEQQDTRPTGAGEREVKTVVSTRDADGGLSPAMQVDQQEKKNSDGTVAFKKTTSMPDLNGRWQVNEIREGTKTENGGQESIQQQSVMRPDANGRMSVVEKTVSTAEGGTGEKKITTETYSTNVPGTAGTDSLQLVQRETTVTQTSASGSQNQTQQIERLTPGESPKGLRVVQKTVQSTQPDGRGSANQKSTISTANSDGRLGQVWVDVGKTDNPAAIQVDTAPPAGKSK